MAADTDSLCENFLGFQAPVDPESKRAERFYHAIRHLMVEGFNYPAADIEVAPKDFTGQRIDFTEFGKGAANATTKQNSRIALVAVYGLMRLDGFNDPTLGSDVRTGGGNIVEPGQGPVLDNMPTDLKIARQFVNSVGGAVNEFNANRHLFYCVYQFLRNAGRAGEPVDSDTTIDPKHVAELGRRLSADKRDPKNPLIRSYIDTAYQTVLGGGVDQRAVALDIKLPDLDDNVAADISQDNVRALSAVYFAAMLEDLKFFATADRVTEDFMHSRIPVSKSNGGQALYNYFKGAQNRMTEIERRGLYARAFGIAQGAVDEAMPNREFADLWVRFLSSANLLRRQIKSSSVWKVSSTQVFKSARDLAVNLSLHGYGLVHFAGVELIELIENAKAMLSFPDVVAAYGARDVWQVVERVSDMYLGGAVNNVRQRVMAQRGGEIIQWLADQNKTLTGPPPADFFQGAAYDTVSAAIDQWLAVTGTNDTTVERYADPVELRAQPTVPQLFSMSGMQGIQDSLKNALQQVNNLNGAKLPQA